MTAATSRRRNTKDQPYHLKSGEGQTYDVGIDITVKAGEAHTRHGAAVIEFRTGRGEEPGDHIHKTEDEMFYVLEGRLTFSCDGKRFNAGPGSFVFLPKGLSHNYAIRGKARVRLLVITSPPRSTAKGWGGFVRDFESAD
jgi:mannose-6-phosphate isomerase-like protein (cupin superfamily)